MSEFVIGRSNEEAMPGFVVLHASDVDEVAEGFARLREELANPTSVTYGDFIELWGKFFEVEFGFYEGYVEIGKSEQEKNEQEIDWGGDGLESLMVWSSSITSALRGKLKDRYHTYNTYYCYQAIGPQSEFDQVLKPWRRDGMHRTAVTDIEAVTDVLRSTGHTCRPAFDTIEHVFEHLATLEYLADGLTEDSGIEKEALLGLPFSITPFD